LTSVLNVETIWIHVGSEGEKKNKNITSSAHYSSNQKEEVNREKTIIFEDDTPPAPPRFARGD